MTGSGWRGYIFSREIGGQIVPQRVQNLVIRHYARQTGLDYRLSAVEYGMPGCFMMLDTLLDELAGLEGLIFYATHLLPPGRTSRARFFERILDAGKAVHFALEALTVTHGADMAPIEDLVLARTLAHGPARPLTLPFDITD